MLGVIFVFLLSAIIAFACWRRWQIFQLRDKLGYPGPDGLNFFLGHIPTLMKVSPKERYRLGLKWKQQYNSNIIGYYIGPMLQLLVFDLDLIKEVLIKEFTLFTDRPEAPSQGDTPISEGLLAVGGEKWKYSRNQLTPTFSSAKMRLMSQAIHRKLDTLMEKFEKRASDGRCFDIYDDFQALTLDVIAQCAFGVNSKCQTDPNDSFLVHCQGFFGGISLEKSWLVVLSLAFPELNWLWGKLRQFSSFGDHEKWLIDGLRDIMQQRRARAKEFKNVDILQLMLAPDVTENATGEQTQGLSDKAIIGNALSFLLAGYETTSTALAYTAWLLAKHPDVQRRLQGEVDEKLGAAKANNEELSYDLVHKMPYLDAVFHESLRYYPPVHAFVSRMCSKECTINQYKFAPHCQIMVPTYAIHHDPDLWSEPDKFDPERFLGENARNHHPMAYIPFGHGPRNCIGMRFADMEWKMCIVTVLSKYNIEFGPESQDPLEIQDAAVLLRPVAGVILKLTLR